MTLKQLRESKGIKQRELAEKLGISPQAISNYEVGKRALPSDKILIYAKILEVDAGEILKCIS